MTEAQDGTVASTPTRRLLLRMVAMGALAGASSAASAQQDSFAPPPMGAADAKKIALRFATNYAGTHPMTKPVREIIAQFGRDYPNVSIAVEESPGDAQ